ncbi:MAG: hypothetical protein WDN75_02995 [Bacteroidota bacterium]
MNRLFVLIIIAIASSASAQDETQKEIIEQVWRPFLQDSIIRARKYLCRYIPGTLSVLPRDDKSVLNYKEYQEMQSRSDSRTLAKGNKKNLELRFTERFSNNDLAVNVGIFKTSYTLKNGTTSDYYGRFHVFLRKENGIWKILVDSDSTEGGKIGEKIFSQRSQWNERTCYNIVGSRLLFTDGPAKATSQH